MGIYVYKPGQIPKAVYVHIIHIYRNTDDFPSQITCFLALVGFREWNLPVICASSAKRWAMPSSKSSFGKCEKMVILHGYVKVAKGIIVVWSRNVFSSPARYIAFSVAPCVTFGARRRVLRLHWVCAHFCWSQRPQTFGFHQLKLPPDGNALSHK